MSDRTNPTVSAPAQCVGSTDFGPCFQWIGHETPHDWQVRADNERLREVGRTLVNHPPYFPGRLVLCRALMCNKPWPCPTWKAAADSIDPSDSGDIGTPPEEANHGA